MNGFAWEFSSVDRSFLRMEFEAPRLEPGEILIRVTICTICGSDLHTYSGRRSAPGGCVLGHEIVGDIVGWGERSSPLDYHGNALRVGQRVTWAMAVGCGQCFYCRQGLSQKCESLFKYGHHSPRPERPAGGLSQYCVLVPGTPVFPIPNSLSDEVACPANCATSTVSAAIRLIKETHSLDGGTALVVGAGMLGLTAAAQLRDEGAQYIVMLDPDTTRLQNAVAFGATDVLSSADRESIRSVLNPITAGRGADVALEFAGATAAVENCIESVRTGGCVLLAGSVFPAELLTVSPEHIVRRMLTVRGLHNYRADDLGHALRFLQRAQHQFPFKDLVARTFSLEQAPEAFEYAQQYRPVRVAVRPHPAGSHSSINQ